MANLYDGLRPLRSETRKLLFFGLIVIVSLLIFGYYIVYGSRPFECEMKPESSNDLPPIHDFRRYPCLSGIPVSLKDIREGNCVRTVLRETEDRGSEGKNDCFQTRLKFGKQTEICTYDPKNDLISEYLHKSGLWEEQLVTDTTQVLQTNPDMVFMDIGCNIGVYTLSVALTGRHVICLDANYENLRMVSRSLTLGRLWDNVTLIWNALSNQHEDVHLKLIKDNIGASRLGAVLSHQTPTGRLVDVRALLLDDLRELVRGKRVFMKIDVERHELFVFQGAYEFFKVVDVRFIQMEMANTDHKLAVVEVLEKFGFAPFEDYRGTATLLKKDILTWPLDVYFIKQS